MENPCCIIIYSTNQWEYERIPRLLPLLRQDIYRSIYVAVFTEHYSLACSLAWSLTLLQQPGQLVSWPAEGHRYYTRAKLLLCLIENGQVLHETDNTTNDWPDWGNYRDRSEMQPIIQHLLTMALNKHGSTRDWCLHNDLLTRQKSIGLKIHSDKSN